LEVCKWAGGWYCTKVGPRKSAGGFRIYQKAERDVLLARLVNVTASSLWVAQAVGRNSNITAYWIL
jgi:hypothetical protein